MRGGVFGNLSPINSRTARTEIPMANISFPRNQKGEPARGTHPQTLSQLTTATGANARRPQTNPMPRVTNATIIVLITVANPNSAAGTDQANASCYRSLGAEANTFCTSA